jgi:hypothetical protein
MWGIEVAQVKAAASSVNSSLIILSRAKAIDHARKPTAAEGMWQCGENTYKANDACDCACGQYDPDCDDPRLETRGCPEKDMVRKPSVCLCACARQCSGEQHITRQPRLPETTARTVSHTGGRKV